MHRETQRNPGRYFETYSYFGHTFRLSADLISWWLETLWLIPYTGSISYNYTTAGVVRMCTKFYGLICVGGSATALHRVLSLYI